MPMLLNWDGINNDQSSYTLRELIDNMRKAGACVEIIGRVMTLDSAEYDGATAMELALEAGSLVACLGARALELLDAQPAASAPGGAEPSRGPRAATRPAA